MSKGVKAQEGGQEPIPSFVRDGKIELSDNSRKVLEKRYLRRGPDGKPAESIPQMFWRVARHVAAPDAGHGGDVEATARVFYELLTSLRFLPNSPTFTGAGTPLGQLAACFVLPISDDMGREPDGIFQTLRDAALIQQTGGGNGFSFSRLRPKGDIVHTSGGRATGPVGFLRVYDVASGVISQGGIRRGANMAVLRADHPDIEDFIRCKGEEGSIANFNISVGITDAFMRAVEADGDFNLVNPRDGKMWKRKTVQARELFNLIARHAYRNGEPGVLFLDTANRANPLPHLGILEATNPCGEQFLLPYENCCLGSINLARHMTEDDRVDWEKLRESVELATHFLDNVITANAYVPVVPQLKEAALRARRIGLGIMGLADMMYRLGIRYGSEEAQEFAAQVVEFIRFHCMRTSIALARERGPFPAIKGSIYDPDNLKWAPPKSLTPYTRLEEWGQPHLDWGEIVEGLRRHGIRNAAQTTVAPTGTTSTVAGCEGYGCEPVFALAYVRHFKDADRDVPLTYVSPLFGQALTKAGLDETSRPRIYDEVLRVGTCQHTAELPEHIRHTFVVSQDITAEEHVRMQAAIQAFVDNSISKCVVGDTLVLTAQGLVSISELSDLRLPDQFEDLVLDIVNPGGVEATSAFYYGGHRETRKIRLSYGFEIEGTPNHRVHVLAEDGSVQFHRLDALKIGDVVVLYSNQQRFGASGQPLPAYSGGFRTNSKYVTFPTHMNTEVAFALGCITSEGAITRNGIQITNNDVDLLTDLNMIFQEHFGLSGTIHRDKRNNVHYLQVNSRPLRNWLLAEMGLKAGAEHKIIPSCILRGGHEEITAFLRGLFLDGYMTADGKLFGITLASEKLIRQLQVLLLNMGVVATTRRTAERAWNLTVQGGELESLAGQISFVEKWKNERLDRRNADRQQRCRNYSRLLPATVTGALRAMQTASDRSPRSLYVNQGTEKQDAYQRTRVNLVQGHRLERTDAYEVYNHSRKDSQCSYASAFFEHDQEGRVYVEVQHVEAGFAEVFDVNVPGSHSFIANGMGNHNTCNLPPDATVQDVETAYLLAWKLGCKGLTVYVTGSREKVVLETRETLAATAELPTRSQAGLPPPLKRQRDLVLRGLTFKQRTPVGTAYVTVNYPEDAPDIPLEVFINVGKAGSEVTAHSEAIGRLISLCLRLTSPRSSRDRAIEIVNELYGIGGGGQIGFGPNRVRSLPDGIAQALMEYLKRTSVESEDEAEAVPARVPRAQLPLPLVGGEQYDSEASSGDLCPNCGQASFIQMEGCRTCVWCGHTVC